MNRRIVLAGAGIAIASSVGGCLQTSLTPGGESDDNPQGTADLGTRLWLEQVTVSETDRDSVDPIIFGNLSEAEQDIVQTALDDGEYTSDTETEPPALEDLRSRIEERTGGGQTLEVYLKRNETYYRVGFAAGDHIIAHPNH
jgi:hypothetical protein